jgi:hypothetical protein
LSEAIEAAIEENEYNEYIVRFLQQLAKEL